jgi:hypothetical protein
LLDSTHKSWSLEDLASAKAQLFQRLRNEYGTETADLMFQLNQTDNAVWFTSPLQQSRARMIRKLQLKLLQVQLQQLQQQKISTTRRKLTFVWATGGHSAAAGHGNLFHESYTARMEDLLKPFFASVNLHFIGRNYAMGGTLSGMEVGTCLTSIFGKDMDVLSWDFGMTDGNGIGLFELYFGQAAIHTNRPAMVGFNMGRHRVSDRSTVVEYMEEHGMPIAYLDDVTVKQVTDLIPESFGKSESEISGMGRLVQNFKCDGKLEVGDPFCNSDRWNPLCPERKYKTSWHPGW